MSLISVVNNLGRPYNVNFVVGKGDVTSRNAFFKPGENIISQDVFDMVKDHPLVKHMLNDCTFVVKKAVTAPVAPTAPAEKTSGKESK
jgi:hypothetical protein